MLHLTDRDRTLVEMLTIRVRLLSLEQIAGCLWRRTPGGLANARRRLARLGAVGLLEVTHVHSRPILPLRAPVLSWAPGQPDPDCAAVAWKLQARWPKPPQLMTVATATRKAANQFGGAGGRLRRCQGEHDLHVTALYLRALRTDPEAAARWFSEDLRPKAGYRQKDPDVLIEFDNGRAPLVMEFGGHYDEARVRDFHLDCRAKGRAYTIW